MSIIKPFRGIRYARRAEGGLSRLIAPPYDVISEEERKALSAKSPHNIVRLILPEGAAGGDRDRYPFEVRLDDAMMRGDWLLVGSAWATGRHEPGRGLQDGLVGFEVGAAQIGTRGWQGRLRMEETYRADREVQLTLGADLGLRGWDPDTFDGTGRALLNLQYRSLWKEGVADFMAVGFLAFVDVGATWDGRVGKTTGGLRGDIGVGALVELSKFSAAEIIRLEVAVPDDGSGVVVTAATSALF